MSHHAFASVGGREGYRLPTPIGRGVFDLFHFGCDCGLVVSLEIREDLKCAIIHRLVPLGRGLKRKGAEGLWRRFGHALYAPEAKGWRARDGIFRTGVHEQVRLLVPCASKEIALVTSGV